MTKKQAKSEDMPRKSGPVDIGGHVGSLYLLEDSTQPYELRIDREGRWFHEGVEIVREDIRNFFSRNIARKEDGDYVVRIGRDECLVIVEDAPFVVVRVTRQPGDGLMLLLNDGGTEPLDPRTIEFKNPNVPYCRVRSNFQARFSRAAYYQFAQFIEFDKSEDKFYVSLDGETFELEGV